MSLIIDIVLLKCSEVYFCFTETPSALSSSRVLNTNFAGEVLRCILWSPYFRYHVNKRLQVQDPVLDL